jgi:uncharacterized protein
MPLIVNLRHLESQSLQLQGELPVAELDLDLRDEIIRAEKPLRYRLEIQKLEQAVLVRGTLSLRLQCECVRCLKPFEHPLELADWTRHVPLDGEEKAAVVNDCVDLTPYLREDILLEIPQHPLCNADCGGMSNGCRGKAKKTGAAARTQRAASAWAELDKLKF